MRLLLLSGLVILLAGCTRKPPIKHITTVEDDDPRMQAAIEKARSSVDQFIQALQKPKRNQSEFSVKMAFTEGSHTEYIWLTPVRYDGDKFHGVVNNPPDRLTNVKRGDRASIEVSKISDWMYVENRKLVGGYTIRVLRAILQGEEREEFERTAPFIIE
jgi:uncharacterized protein YegJ (DUF2314 family)